MSRRTRTVLLAIGALVVVLLVGGAALAAAHRGGGSLRDDTPGGPDIPLTVTEGRAFEVAGFDYAAGWSLSPDDHGHLGVTGLTVTNQRGHDDWAFVRIRLLSGYEVEATAECTSYRSRIAEGQTVTLGCSSSDPMPASWDSVSIQDKF